MVEGAVLPGVSGGADCGNVEFRCFRSGETIFAWPEVAVPPDHWSFAGAEFEIICRNPLRGEYCVRRTDGEQSNNPHIFVINPAQGVTSFIVPYSGGGHEVFLLASQSALLGPRDR
jgi:hypothetical protein